jgi:hypothetical protein
LATFFSAFVSLRKLESFEVLPPLREKGEIRLVSSSHNIILLSVSVSLDPARYLRSSLSLLHYTTHILSTPQDSQVSNSTTQYRLFKGSKASQQQQTRGLQTGSFSPDGQFRPASTSTPGLVTPDASQSGGIVFGSGSGTIKTSSGGFVANVGGAATNGKSGVEGSSQAFAESALGPGMASGEANAGASGGTSNSINDVDGTTAMPTIASTLLTGGTNSGFVATFGLIKPASSGFVGGQNVQLDTSGTTPDNGLIQTGGATASSGSLNITSDATTFDEATVTTTGTGSIDAGGSATGISSDGRAGGTSGGFGGINITAAALPTAGAGPTTTLSAGAGITFDNDGSGVFGNGSPTKISLPTAGGPLQSVRQP